MPELELHSTTLFAELLLPVPVASLYTYRVPAQFEALVVTGQRAVVQFGDRRVLTGIIINLHRTPPSQYEAKYILDLLDDGAVLSPLQYSFLTWIAEYYMCTTGEVLHAALPSGLKLSSESKVQLNPAFTLEDHPGRFSEKELILLEALEKNPLNYSEISKLLSVKHVYNILKSLVGKEAIILFEEVKEKYQPRKERRVRLATSYNNQDRLQEVFEALASKPRQEEILLRYLQHVPVFRSPERNAAGLRRSVLAEGLSESSINTLVKNGILEDFEVIVSRFESDDGELPPEEGELSPEQLGAYTQILQSFDKHDATVLQGITGSGKTEIYIRLIRNALEAGSQVLYLLPEIALTTQIVQRLKRIFGAGMGVYHSRFSDNERVEVWNGVLKGKFRFVVGVRSSVFLPFDNLGLIIVDEEHESSYKQQEPNPRYHARDVALMLGKFHHAKVLLGSATPSVESWLHARQGRYGYVRLDKRYGEAALPRMIIADLGRERKSKTIKGEFSSVLIRNIEQSLSNGEQVIIFQNRRGYSPVLSCEDCGWTPECVNCAVSLTYHQFRHSLICHYCGYREPLPEKCPSCSSTHLRAVGYGTEKLEEELRLHFPTASVQRMDLDTTRSRTGYETIIGQFERGETNILVGTQMVTKGLDFGNVSLVGVFNADRMIHFPDFRSYERAYQLITQVSGRAGRRAREGRVVIQTASPDHPLLGLIIGNKSEEFYETQLRDRQLHGYPPYTRLIEITLKHQDRKVVQTGAAALANNLRDSVGGVTVLGPVEPMISRIRNLFLMTILIKIPRGKADLRLVKTRIHTVVTGLQREKEHRNTRVTIDVDPA